MCKKNANKTQSHYNSIHFSSKSTSNIHSPSMINTPLPARMPLMGFVNIPKKVMQNAIQRSAFPLAHVQLQRPLLQHYYYYYFLFILYSVFYSYVDSFFLILLYFFVFFRLYSSLLSMYVSPGDRSSKSILTA